MKVLAIIFIFFILAGSASRNYTFKGTEIWDADDPSCGAAERLQRETWNIVLGESAWVNKVKWEVYRDQPEHIVLTHRSTIDSLMFMFINIYPDSATVTLQGITDKRVACQDTVSLERVKK
jgi:hypothetical protein